MYIYTYKHTYKHTHALSYVHTYFDRQHKYYMYTIHFAWEDQREIQCYKCDVAQFADMCGKVSCMHGYLVIYISACTAPFCIPTSIPNSSPTSHYGLQF